MNQNTSAKDLTKEAPRSPHAKVGNYVILGRTIDKCRALLWGNIGEYHFDCPLDNFLFDFKGIKADDFKAQIERGATDEEMAKWVDGNGTAKTADEVKEWVSQIEAMNPYANTEKREWYVEQVTPLGLDPAKTPLFDWLDADDKATYAKVG